MLRRRLVYFAHSLALVAGSPAGKERPMPYRARGMRSAPTLAFLLVGALAVVALAACGDDDEPPAESPTSSASATSRATVPPTSTALGPGGGGLDTTVVPNPSPLPTAQSPGDDWTKVEIPASRLSGEITFSHPPDWIVTSSFGHPEAGILTVVLRSPGGDKGALEVIGKDSLKIDLVSLPIADSTPCEPIATIPADFGGLDGFRVVEEPSSTDTSGIARVESRQAEHGGFRYCMAAYLGNSTGKVPTPDAMLAAFLATLHIGTNQGN